MDIAVWLKDQDAAIDLQYALAKYLSIAEQDINIVILNNYELLPCTLIIEDLSKEKPVYYKDLETFLV